MSKIYGVSRLDYRVSPGDIPTVTLELLVGGNFNPQELYNFDQWDDQFPGSVVVKCQYCGQWGARKCQCKHCGGAIE